MNNIELITMVYKSVYYLDLIVSELKKDYCKVPNVNVGIRVIANDANPAVLKRLEELYIPFSIYNDPKPSDYYLNRVYRCWNYGGYTSTFDNICFVNSDMVFSENWLSNLWTQHDGNNIPCSRLVESGKLLSGTHAISKNFGRNATSINFNAWNNYTKRISLNELHAGGLYMPCIFNKQRFIESGMYPEGNIYSDGKAGSMVGQVTLPGDVYYFNKLRDQYGMNHVTVFDSLVYHIQEGELDE
jgi:hypothetical protein